MYSIYQVKHDNDNKKYLFYFEVLINIHNNHG